LSAFQILLSDPTFFYGGQLRNGFCAIGNALTPNHACETSGWNVKELLRKKLRFT
jgi:hypothetical protein